VVRLLSPRLLSGASARRHDRSVRDQSTALKRLRQWADKPVRAGWDDIPGCRMNWSRPSTPVIPPASRTGPPRVDAGTKESGTSVFGVEPRAAHCLTRPDSRRVRRTSTARRQTSPARLRALERGANLTPDELALGQHLWSETCTGKTRTVMSTPCGGSWRRSTAGTAERCTRPNWQRATRYRGQVSFRGAFATFGDALDALRRRGYIDLDDYEPGILAPPAHQV